MTKSKHVRRAWASGRTTIGKVYDTKRELARNIGGWNAKRVAIVDLFPAAVDALALKACAIISDREHDDGSLYTARLVLTALLGPLPKPRKATA